MKTLYLHIGTPKTGTKAIQHFCWENPGALSKYGFCYPDLSALCTDYTPIKNGHFLIGETVDGRGEDKKGENRRREKYDEGMQAVIKFFDTQDNIILSDEGLYRATSGGRKKLLKNLKADGEKYGFTVKVVVYLRRQDEFANSLYNQKIKMKSGETAQQSWEEYISLMPGLYQLNYFEKMESMADILGRENVIVRRYERESFYGGSIYSDFMYALGLELTEEFIITKEERNQNLPGNTQEMMRILNGVPNLSENDLKFIRCILYRNGEISKEQYPCSMFSQKERKKFLSDYKKSNRLVAEKYLGERGNDLFADTISDLPKYTPDNPYMQQDIIRFVALGLKKIRDENIQLKTEQKALKQELARIRTVLQA